MIGSSESLGPRFESWRAHQFLVPPVPGTVCPSREWLDCPLRGEWFESYRAHQTLLPSVPTSETLTCPVSDTVNCPKLLDHRINDLRDRRWAEWPIIVDQCPFPILATRTESSRIGVKSWGRILSGWFHTNQPFEWQVWGSRDRQLSARRRRSPVPVSEGQA